jgi:hypothetical protein
MPIEYFEGTADQTENQCLFIRGFRVALGRGALADTSRPASTSRIEDTRARDIFPSSVPGSSESSGQGSLLSRFSGQGNEGTSQSGGQIYEHTRNDDQEVSLLTDYLDLSDVSITSVIHPELHSYRVIPLGLPPIIRTQPVSARTGLTTPLFFYSYWR